MIPVNVKLAMIINTVINITMRKGNHKGKGQWDEVFGCIVLGIVGEGNILN